MSEIELSGSRILVLGASGVLGGLIAHLLAERGATVALAGRSETDLAARAEGIDGDTPVIVFDLRAPADCTAVVEKAAGALGGLDGVVNAAGVVAFGPLSELDDATFDELVAADLTGPVRVMRAAIARMDDGGFLVNITGVVAEQPTAGLTAYSAVKAGLSAASAALHKEARRNKITVLDARPPHTETGLADRAIAGTAPSMPDGLDPAEVAAVIVDAIESGRRELPPSAFTGD